MSMIPSQILVNSLLVIVDIDAGDSTIGSAASHKLSAGHVGPKQQLCDITYIPVIPFPRNKAPIIAIAMNATVVDVFTYKNCCSRYIKLCVTKLYQV